MPDKGKLFLIPNVIAPDTQDSVLSFQIRNTLPGISFFLAEDLRTARRFLSSLHVYPSIETLHFSVLDKDTVYTAMRELFSPIFAGNDLGVLSEAGCPGIADPGAMAVQFAHENGIKVIPLVGPSSILLALMASGLNGQRFSFHGYLPIEKGETARAIRDLEKESKAKNQTQIFIETPYRNNSLLQHLISNLSPETRLTLALDLTGASEMVTTKKIREWKLQTVELPKKPAVFLFLA
jgi:16S rRNA (cytidine1402-2'-O)-methyltransferase